MRSLCYVLVLTAACALLTGPVLANPKGPGADGSEDSEGRCIREAFIEPDGDEMAKELEASEQPLHEAGAKLARNFICNGRTKCLDKHGDRLSKAAHVVVSTCLEDPQVPKYICLGLVAAISNEGGAVEHPSCGQLNIECVLRCDQIWVNGARHDCFKQCAIDQGITRYTSKARWKRIQNCNDKGTSRGPFQMKMQRVRWCRKMFRKTSGEDFDPFDMAQAARCISSVIKRVALAKRFPCRTKSRAGKSQNRWLIAFTRVTRGVLRTVQDAQPGRWVPDAFGQKSWIEPQPKITEQICSESSYGLRGLRYYQACGKKCQKVRHKVHKAPDEGEGREATEGLESPTNKVDLRLGD